MGIRPRKIKEYQMKWLTKLFTPPEPPSPTAYIVHVASNTRYEPYYDYVVYRASNLPENVFDENAVDCGPGTRFAFTPIGLFQPDTEVPLEEVDKYRRT